MNVKGNSPAMLYKVCDPRYGLPAADSCSMKWAKAVTNLWLDSVPVVVPLCQVSKGSEKTFKKQEKFSLLVFKQIKLLEF
jgi:hypothetical protein